MPPAEGKHSPIGASSCERWYNCPGSIPRSVGKPNKGSVYAAEGTVTHGLGEDLIRGKIKKEALYDRVGEVVKSGDFEVPITDEMVEGAILYFDTLAGLFAEIKANEKPAPITWKCEEPIHLVSVDDDAYGTCDFALWRKGDKLIIVDFKFGQRLVNPERNKQMMYYAIGMMDGAAGWVFDEVELIIVQPRARHADGPVRRWTTNTKELKAFAADLKAKVAETRLGAEAPVSSGEWCKYCPAMAECPEKYKDIQAAAGADFSVIPAADATPAAEAVRLLPSVDVLSLEALARALAYEDIISEWFTAAKERARAALESGVAVPGHKLVRKKTNRVWRDEAEVAARFEPIVGDAIWQKKLQGITWFEKKVGKDAVNELTVKPEGALTVAPEYDPRPAVIPSAAADFQAVSLDSELGGLL